MNINKNKITAIVYLVLILLLLTGYFFWLIFFRPAKPKSEQAFIPPVNEKQVYKSADEITPPENPLSGKKLNIPTLPVPKPNLGTLFEDKILPTSTMSFFENIYKAAKTVETKLKNEIAAPTQTIPSAPSIILSLTNDEFHFLYPDAFIASLIDSQSLLIKSYDPTYEPILKIETDSQVRHVEEKIVAALLSANMLTKEEAERAITTIRFTLPQLQLVDLKNRNSSISNQSPINQCSILSPRPSSKGLFLAGLVEKLYNAYIPKAQAYACGYCYFLPECFQPGISSPLPGPNLWFAFCYCTGCYSSLGCLSFCIGRAAIYDPTTGICGCG